MAPEGGGVADSQPVTRVPITVRLLGDFMEDLRNDSSTTYINFTEEFNRAVTSMFKVLQSFVGVEIQHYSAGSIVVEFDIIIEEEIVDVDDVIDVVSVIASSLASSNSTLGNFTVGEVSFVADDNTTSAVTPCDCGQLNCVNVLGDCVAFCSSNINYCFNGGTCRSNRTTHLSCDCLVTQDAFYTGERCENEVVVTRPPTTTGVDTESPTLTDTSENWTVFVTTVDMTTASNQRPEKPSSAKTTISSTSTRGMNSSTALTTTRTTVLRDSTVQPTTSTTAANVSVPAPTPSPKSGPVPPSECTFPFEYDNKVYHECTTTNSSHPWCAWDSFYRYSRWGYCEVQEPKEPGCSFPFMYHGNYYFSCTTENSYRRPWCAYDTRYQQENWRHCDGSEEVHEPEKPEDTECAFPFVYKGNIYYSCTTEDYIVPWCARDRLYHPDRWVLCASKTTDTEHDTAEKTLLDERCQSQFWYKDELYTGCTDQDSLYPWCAWDVTYQKGRWSVCDAKADKDTDGSGDLSGSGSGDEEEEGSALSPKNEDEDAWLWDDTSCHIPFVYKGKTYSRCTTKDSLVPWCSVDPVFQPGLGRWAFCTEEQSRPQPPRDEDTPPKSTDTDGQCVFPFYYNGMRYTGCAMADALTPWCAWDQVYRKNRWSYCEKALPEPSGVEGRPYDCVFPFHFGGHWKYDCIVSESGRPWCPWDQFYRTGRYSFCDVDKKNEKPPSEGSGEPEMSGSGEEVACTFPFYYNDVLYKRCALVDSLLPWCAWDETFQEGRWSVCDFTHDQANSSEDDTSGSGSGEDMENILCTFPFLYKHKEYNECTMDDSLIPWCAWDKIYDEGRWSHCNKEQSSAPHKPERPDKCVFPFNYEGQWHYDCAVSSIDMAWCAWDKVYVHGRFSFCDLNKGEGSAEGSGNSEPGELEETSGSGAAIPCTFPFKYEGIWYEGCSPADSVLPWCAWDAEFQPERWSVCDGTNKKTDDGSNKGSGEIDEDQSDPWLSGAEDAWLWDETSCVFPFMYKGVLYRKCTTHDSSHPWCSVDAIYQQGWGRWAYCSKPNDNANSTKPTQMPEPYLRDPRCIFPFYYNKKWHSECAMEDSLIPWCAWDYVLQPDRWSYCETTERPAEGSGHVESSGEEMSGSGDETLCVFPFRYHGIWHSDCTLVDSIVPWCAWDHDYKEGRYTICKEGRKTSNAHPTEASGDSETSGSGDEEKCSFQFMYSGVLYTGCTNVDSIVPWCAWDQRYQEGRYSICDELAEVYLPDTKDEKACVFPFRYDGDVYDSCTTKDSVTMPWCAWDGEYQLGHWSYCKGTVKPTSSPPPAVPAECVFPFYYRGQRYNECTAVGFALPWCAWDHTYTEGRWSVCKEKPSEEQPRPSDENCAFPFVYRGLAFTQCTTVDSTRPWCSWGHLHMAGRWSYCECTFPFRYQGRTYHSCTTDGWHEPWCALDSQYLPHRWTTCTEVLITTEVVTSAPRTDVDIVTEFFTPNIATEVIDLTTAIMKTTEIEREFSTQETTQDTTVYMAQSTVTELLPDATEQAKEEATTNLDDTSMGTDETTMIGVQGSTQVFQATTGESVLVTTRVMEVETTVETLEETSHVTAISEATSQRTHTDIPLNTTPVLDVETTVKTFEETSAVTAIGETTSQRTHPVVPMNTTGVLEVETTVETLEETSAVTAISETTSQRTHTDMALVTTDDVQESTVILGQTTVSPTPVQVLTTSVVDVSTSEVIQGTTSGVVQTTTSSTQAKSSPAVQTSSTVPLSTSGVVSSSTSTEVQETTTAGYHNFCRSDDNFFLGAEHHNACRSDEYFCRGAGHHNYCRSDDYFCRGAGHHNYCRSDDYFCRGAGHHSYCRSDDYFCLGAGHHNCRPDDYFCRGAGHHNFCRPDDYFCRGAEHHNACRSDDYFCRGAGHHNYCRSDDYFCRGAEHHNACRSDDYFCLGAGHHNCRPDDYFCRGAGHHNYCRSDDYFCRGAGHHNYCRSDDYFCRGAEHHNACRSDDYFCRGAGHHNYCRSDDYFCRGAEHHNACRSDDYFCLGAGHHNCRPDDYFCRGAGHHNFCRPDDYFCRGAEHHNACRSDDYFCRGAGHHNYCRSDDYFCLGAGHHNCRPDDYFCRGAGHHNFCRPDDYFCRGAEHHNACRSDDYFCRGAGHHNYCRSDDYFCRGAGHHNYCRSDDYFCRGAGHHSYCRSDDYFCRGTGHHNYCRSDDYFCRGAGHHNDCRPDDYFCRGAEHHNACRSDDYFCRDTGHHNFRSPNNNFRHSTCHYLKPIVASAVAIEVQITSQNFTQELTNSNTTEYQQLAQELIDYLSQLYADVPGFQGIVINGFREGSVIAEFDVIIESQVAASPMEIGSVLQTAMENTDNTLGNFVVGQLRVAVEGNFTEMSTCSNREGCGNGIRCTKIGDTCVAFCRTNPGYCYNGGQCSDSANDHLTCLCPWNLWRYYSGDKCQNVDTSVILYIIIGSCAGGLLILLTAVSGIAIMVKRSRNKSFAHSVGHTPDPGQEGSVRRYGYSKDPFMRSLAEMLEQNAPDENQLWNKQVGHTNESFLYQPEVERREPEEGRAAEEESRRDLLSKMRIYDAQVHDGMQTISSATGSQDITIHFPPRPSRPTDNTGFAPLNTYNPRLLKDVHL
ncbi:ELSPBP1 [Branchiostoma lanceolatum]|uniref:ELSPBP1 protein n=1 Tax=Branchiostoma lanceolatum TaxID=7740 RepID=A0A8J9ZN04_BRALA|nr:ELSPBP1 [Branchiostoma lanceolatum]